MERPQQIRTVGAMIQMPAIIGSQKVLTFLMIYLLSLLFELRLSSRRSFVLEIILVVKVLVEVLVFFELVLIVPHLIFIIDEARILIVKLFRFARPFLQVATAARPVFTLAHRSLLSGPTGPGRLRRPPRRR
jgi:hypothetical protein